MHIEKNGGQGDSKHSAGWKQKLNPLVKKDKECNLSNLSAMQASGG